MKRIVVAIDGPAGAGKSTISKLIAGRLNLEFIDTGAMYRSITLKVIREGINVRNMGELNAMLDSTCLSFVNGRLILDGEDVSEEIRSREVSDRVSEVSAIQSVREKLVEIQRKMAENTNVIMDGRDIGTNVLKDANYKIYLTASVEERAERRYKELKEKGIIVNYETICREIEERDLKDMSRDLNPLRKASDAVLVDTTGKGINEVVEDILAIINNGEENNYVL